MWRLAKQKGKGHPLLLPSSRGLLLAGRLRLFSSSTLATVCRDPPPPEPPGFMVEYLVSACGLSRAEADRTSKYLAHVKSPKKPDAVLRFMRQEGLGEAQIRRLVLWRPTVLVADVKKTLEPKIADLLEAGFSGPELAQLISSTGLSFPRRGVQRRIVFWRNLLGDNQNLLKAIDRSGYLLYLKLEERVFPTLSFLRSLGVSDEKIGAIMMRSNCLIFSSLGRIMALVEQIKNLGISPDSGMFGVALSTISNISKSTLDAKVKLLMSFGWSQAELFLAFRRSPQILNISQKKIRSVMDFLLKDAGCSPVYIASRPVILGLSIQRRLMPRFRVLQTLKLKCLPGGDHDFYNFMLIPEKKFVEKYIVPNSDKAPELLEAYLAASAKSISR